MRIVPALFLVLKKHPPRELFQPKSEDKAKPVIQQTSET
jgi:hypothetical protein